MHGTSVIFKFTTLLGPTKIVRTDKFSETQFQTNFFQTWILTNFVATFWGEFLNINNYLFQCETYSGEYGSPSALSEIYIIFRYDKSLTNLTSWLMRKMPGADYTQVRTFVWNYSTQTHVLKATQ